MNQYNYRGLRIFNLLIFINFFQENNKSPNRNKFTTPKSPSRKTKTRISKSSNIRSNFNDLNEKNKSEKEKSETVTSEKVIAHTNAFNQSNNANVPSPLTIQKNSAGILLF